MITKRQLGVCTWTFGDMSLAEIAHRLAAFSYDGVELMGNLNAYQPAEAAKILQDHNLKVFSLTPDNVDLAHPDDTVRAKAIDYYLRLLDFAAALAQASDTASSALAPSRLLLSLPSRSSMQRSTAR